MQIWICGLEKAIYGVDWKNNVIKMTYIQKSLGNLSEWEV